MSAIREANQIGTLQPTTLVAHAADIRPIFDASEAAALQAQGFAAADVADVDWRLTMLNEGRAPTQQLAERLRGEGYAGMQVRSFAKAPRGRT